jgi:hypothetical protein
MARKPKHDDDEPVVEEVATEAESEAEGEPAVPPEEPAPVVAEDPEQPPSDLAEQQPEGEAPVEEKKEKKRRGGPKVYTLQVSRNDAEWADVAHSTVAIYNDNRDLQQVPVGYTKAQAAQVAEDWERAGYNVRLVEVGTESEPEPEPEPPVEP